jgi:hypothetical protein
MNSFSGLADGSTIEFLVHEKAGRQKQSAGATCSPGPFEPLTVSCRRRSLSGITATHSGSLALGNLRARDDLSAVQLENDHFARGLLNWLAQLCQESAEFFTKIKVGRSHSRLASYHRTAPVPK